MNATLIISNCISILCDHCIFTYMSYMFYVFYVLDWDVMQYLTQNLSDFFFLLLLCHRDIESKSGPKKFSNSQPFKFCHWNLSSVLSEDCFKVSLLKSFIALHNFDFIYFSKTFLSPSVSFTPDSLNVDSYNIVRSDHPSGSKREGVWYYFKESFLIRILEITPITERLLLEILYDNKLVIVSFIYRSPGQSSQECAPFEMLPSQLLNDISSKNPFCHYPWWFQCKA